MKRYWTLLVLFVVQLACALFFVGDILASVFGLPIGPMPWELRELLDVIRSAARVERCQPTDQQ